MTSQIFRSSRARFAPLVALGLAVGGGCGGGSDELERRYAASGTVTYKGAPVAHGEIAFAPVDPTKGRAASSTIVDGAFSLTTMTERDGAIPGPYRVSVTAIEGAEPTSGRPGGKSHRDPAVIREAARTRKNLVPKKYESTASSPLTAEVKAQSNSYTFDLTD